MIKQIIFFFISLKKKEKKYIRFSLIYIFFVLIILSYILFKSDFINISSIDFIKNLGQNINHFYKTDKLLFIIFFSLGIFIWVFLLGFMTPVILLGGYIFGAALSTLVIALSNAFAATIFFFIVRVYFKNIIKKLVSTKFKFIINFLNKDINNYFLFYRILGDFGVPSAFSNIIPVFTKIKNKNYFIITFIGSIPLIYVWSNFGQSIHYISNVEKINFSTFSDPKVYFSIILLAVISVIPPIAKKILFIRKKK